MTGLLSRGDAATGLHDVIGGLLVRLTGTKTLDSTFC